MRLIHRATCTMAEVPLPTPTKVPVPSTDIRNAVFAGAKLDEEVTGTGDFYTDRLDVKRLTNTGRNNQFNAAQQERADQFQQFLLSSGYVFLGDYEDGPFQFSARNQYIRYNDQYYRLNATTDVGFTTTGTDATSLANDVAHFVLMDGDTLRQNLGSGAEGMGDNLVTHFPGGAFSTPRSVNNVLNEKVSILDFYSDSANDDTERFKKAQRAGHKVVHIPQRSISGPMKVGELDITTPMVLQGEGVISIASTGSTIMKTADSAYGIQYIGDINNRPHGGGLRNIDFRGEVDTSTGVLLRVETWSYFWCEMLNLLNISGWGLSLKNVAEGGVINFLCRRLGSDDTGCIRFEDYLNIPNNNVNNFRLINGTFGFNSGNWIYGTDQSNTDAIWIENNKFEYDDKPTSGNITPKSIIYLGNAGVVSINNNKFTNFKLSNINVYSDCIQLGENSRFKTTINGNKFDGCDNTLINIKGGAVDGDCNSANRAGAPSDGTFSCTSSLPQDIEPIVYHLSNGAKNKRSNYSASDFLSAHQMVGSVNNPFVNDAGSMTHYGTVMSVQASTEIRRGTISRAQILDRGFVHITARIKNTSGTTSSVVLVIDGTPLSSLSVASDSNWHTYTWQIRPDKITNGSFTLTNGPSSILFDGVFIEKKDYYDWSFLWSPGSLVAGSRVASPTQKVADTTGFAATMVKAIANNTLNGAELTCETDPTGDVIVYCLNNTSTTVTPSFTRVRLRYETSGNITS